MRVVIKKSTNPKKKYMAIFYDGDKKKKTTHFGFISKTDPNNDYTKHKDDRKKRKDI